MKHSLVVLAMLAQAPQVHLQTTLPSSKMSALTRKYAFRWKLLNALSCLWKRADAGTFNGVLC